jgi:NAD(P)-dependent dehydrogenase (short-subunit alcohol dehydrogenase family)
LGGLIKKCRHERRQSFSEKMPERRCHAASVKTDMQGKRCCVASFLLIAPAQSKLANLMFTYELQRRLASLGNTIAVAAHLGISNTELIRNLPAGVRSLAGLIAPLLTQTPEMGALPTLRAATDPAVLGG